MAKGTVFVASPSATASTPEAMGSSVPACPAFCASKARLTVATAWVDVVPTGLSTTTQPCTASPLRLRAIAVLAVLAVSDGFQVALYAFGFEERLDLFRFGERIVFGKSQFRREAQPNGVTEHAAQVPTVAVERLDHAIRILPAERFAKNDGVAHVRRRLDLCDRDGNAFEIGIAHFTARQDFGQRVTQNLANAQLTL